MSDLLKTCAELKALLETATPGPWRACHEGKCKCGQIWSEATDACLAQFYARWGDAPDMIYGDNTEEARTANEQLTCSLRNAAPDLIAAAEQNADLLAQLEAEKVRDRCAHGIRWPHECDDCEREHQERNDARFQAERKAREEAEVLAKDQGHRAVELFDECRRAQTEEREQQQRAEALQSRLAQVEQVLRDTLSDLELRAKLEDPEDTVLPISNGILLRIRSLLAEKKGA